jgi:hypothetical protein
MVSDFLSATRLELKIKFLYKKDSLLFILSLFDKNTVPVLVLNI